jgi:hypothetical protein
MVDVAQLLATYDALVGVALGAGLTYGFGALNRRRQDRVNVNPHTLARSRLTSIGEFFPWPPLSEATVSPAQRSGMTSA